MCCTHFPVILINTCLGYSHIYIKYIIRRYDALSLLDPVISLECFEKLANLQAALKLSLAEYLLSYNLVVLQVSECPDHTYVIINRKSILYHAGKKCSVTHKMLE
jgi:hypothetical protein